jgi:hypothetical protein
LGLGGDDAGERRNGHEDDETGDEATPHPTASGHRLWSWDGLPGVEGRSDGLDDDAALARL